MRFKQFEIIQTVKDEDRYELVKWNKDNSSRLVIAYLVWKKDEWYMENVGLRILEFYEPGLNEFVMAWLALAEVCKKAEADE